MPYEPNFYEQWLAQQWPAAQALGVARATFDAATRGLEPDLTLPDLALPGQAEKAPQQPEFVQTPSQYLRETSFDRLATRGRQLAVQYRDALDTFPPDPGARRTPRVTRSGLRTSTRTIAATGVAAAR